MSDDRFGFDNDKELDTEDYAYLEDEEKLSGGGLGYVHHNSLINILLVPFKNGIQFS